MTQLAKLSGSAFAHEFERVLLNVYDLAPPLPPMSPPPVRVVARMSMTIEGPLCLEQPRPFTDSVKALFDIP